MQKVVLRSSVAKCHGHDGPPPFFFAQLFSFGIMKKKKKPWPISLPVREMATLTPPPIIVLSPAAAVLLPVLR